jgi:4-hydroxy-3-methylbut-2-en-1-yl diphosphate synthase IspG/GcpE
MPISRLNLLKHIRTKHSVAVPVACPQCGRTFKNAYNMKDHLRKSHAIWQRENSYIIENE